jgi:hypothetical protein
VIKTQRSPVALAWEKNRRFPGTDFPCSWFLNIFGYFITKTPILKKLCQNLFVHQFGVEALAQDLYAAEVLLAEGKEVNAVLVLVDEAAALDGEFIEAVRFQPAQEGAFLDPFQAVLFAGFSHPAPGLVLYDIVNDPHQYGHLNPP